MSSVTIVMYHYVRELPLTRYPKINGLKTSQFKEQIRYLKKFYNFITVEECLAAITEGESHRLPKNSLILTFDDAYLDHFTEVFPILQAEGIQGAFFPPAKAITEHQVLSVNKIHFLLASGIDLALITQDILSNLDDYREDYVLESNEFYLNTYAHANRFDTKEVIFIKRMLQMGIDESLRDKILDQLFKQHVTQDEAAFSCELYMNMDQLKCLRQNGMHVGSHGYDHYWLGELDEAGQRDEIVKSKAFLQELGCDMKNWTLCYPYGSFNDGLVKLLPEYGCKMGFATQVGIADLTTDSPLTLPRLDTNDFPKEMTQTPNGWTEKIL